MHYEMYVWVTPAERDKPERWEMSISQAFGSGFRREIFHASYPTFFEATQAGAVLATHYRNGLLPATAVVQ